MKKNNFFSRMKTAVINFDKYEGFIDEKVSISIFYMLKLLLIISIIVSFAITYVGVKQIKAFYELASQYVPDFEFNNYMLEAKEPVEHADEENDMYLVVNTGELNEQQITEYTDKAVDYAISVIFMKDKIIYNNQDILYKDILASYNIENISFNKKEAISFIEENAPQSVLYFVILVPTFLAIFISFVISVISDALMLFLLGMIVTKLSRVALKPSSVFPIAIYSLTLPLLLLTAYDVVTSLTSFRMEYFNVIYISIGYIYIIAAILMIKSDEIKQNMEVSEIVKVQNQVKEELKNEDKEENKEENKEQNGIEEEKKEKDDGDINEPEPNGSEI